MNWSKINHKSAAFFLILSAILCIPKREERVEPAVTQPTASSPALEPLDDGYKGDPLKFKIESIVKSKRLCSSDEYENICRGLSGDDKFLLVRDDAAFLFTYSFTTQLTKANVNQTDYAMAAFDRLSQVIGTDSSKELLRLLKLERLSPNLFPDSSRSR